MRDRLRLGTRTTPLALWQAEHVADRLRTAHPGLAVDLVSFVTEGDRRQDQPLPAIGAKGLFTSDLEAALHDGRIDLAVHSLKDLPVEEPEGLTLGALLARDDARDAWFCPGGYDLATLPPGAVVGTSSMRRAAQLLAQRPDLQIQSIRGRVETRLRKVEDGLYDATVLALAGLRRLGLEDVATAILGFDVMLPAPGQAALAAQCRTDSEILDLLRAIDDVPTRRATTAERTFLLALGGGCSAPIGAYAEANAPVANAPTDSATLTLRGVLLAPDGSRRIDVLGAGTDPVAVAHAAADQARALGAAEVWRG